MKQLLSILKSDVCPNETEESINTSTKEKEKHKYFEPMHFTFVQWTAITASNADTNIES